VLAPALSRGQPPLRGPQGTSAATRTACRSDPTFYPCPLAPYAPAMSQEVRDRRKLALGAAAFVVWLAISAATGNASSQRPTYRYTPGYENPAPGDDGTPDCPPAGGPVLVPANDPYGLDGNGNGVGCEG
jgi:hypothetical protein